MAIVKAGAVGKFRGKIGNLSLTSWGKAYVARSLPKETYVKASAATLERRYRFGMVSNFLKLFKEAITLGYPRNRTYTSNMNVIVKNTLANAVVGSYPDLEIDPEKLQLSVGALSQVYNLKSELSIGAKYISLTAFWQNPPILKLGLSEYDHIHLCTVAEFKDELYFTLHKNVAFRMDGTCTIQQQKLDAITLKAWMFILSEDGKQASATKYLGNFILE